MQIKYNNKFICICIIIVQLWCNYYKIYSIYEMLWLENTKLGINIIIIKMKILTILSSVIKKLTLYNKRNRKKMYSLINNI